MSKKKIMLKWIDPQNESHYSEMDYCFKRASYETFEELVKDTEKTIDSIVHEYGSKEWVYRYSPYQVIKFYEDGKLVAHWSAMDYINKNIVKKGGSNDNFITCKCGNKKE